MIQEFMIIFLVNYVGILISGILHLPVPGTIIGLILMFILLKTNALKIEKIEKNKNSKEEGENASQDTDTVHAHLDKSHITVHTFPEYHPDNSISTFRVDIDIATCGEISPLNTLNYLIDSFDSDIITIDYRIRGFTRDISGKKFFTDHNITSIQDYIEPEKLKIYDAIDVNVYQSNIFHTKMLIKEIRLQNYLFNQDVYEIAPKKRLEITDRLRKEMIEIYSGMNIY